MMRTKLLLTLAGLIGTAQVLSAAYVIKLKNGNEYVTTRYWNEGSQVRFDTYGGVFGVDKSFVVKIERSDRVVPLPVSATSAPKKASDTTLSSAPLTEKGAANPKPGEADIKAPRPAQPATAKEPLKKDENVLKEYAELQTRFGQLNDLPTHEIYALDADIASFRQKVASSNLAEAHRDELDAMRTLQGAIVSYLKASQR
jgi:hypothetical protein